MSRINKFLWYAALAVVAALVGFLLAQANKGQKMSEEIGRLRLELSECGHREREAVYQIGRQNAAIEAVRVDTLVVERAVKSVVDRYAYIRETVRINAERDTSCEGKINNIGAVLRGFHHGAELRAASSDAR